MKFPAPEGGGKHQLDVYLICDSYIGCDQQQKLVINIFDESEQKNDEEIDELEVE